MPDHLIVHVLLQLTNGTGSGAQRRRDALSVLAFMCTCRRLMRLVEESDPIWEAMVKTEVFAPTGADAAGARGATQAARKRFRQLRAISLTGFWQVQGRYASGETYSYEMQLCDFPHSKIWPSRDGAAAGEPDALDLHVFARNPALRSHYALPGAAPDPQDEREAEARLPAHCDWVLGDVAGPWRMRIVAKCTRNMVVFNEVCADDSPHGRWVNLCSAVIAPDGSRMEGVWMQTRDGVSIVSPHNSGTFEAALVETPPAGADHVEWYYAEREKRRRSWAGRTEGGVTYDDGEEGGYTEEHADDDDDNAYDDGNALAHGPEELL